MESPESLNFWIEFFALKWMNIYVKYIYVNISNSFSLN